MPGKHKKTVTPEPEGGLTATVYIPDRDGAVRPLIAGSVLRGSVQLCAPPLSPGDADVADAVWCVRRLRVQCEGVESHHITRSAVPLPSAVRMMAAKPVAVGPPVVHLWRAVTLIGEATAEEAAAARLQESQEEAFAQRNSRAAPLAATVLAAHGDGSARGEEGAASAEGAGAAGAAHSCGAPSPAEVRILPGSTAEVSFAVKLPPWLPPSLAYELDGVARGEIRYSVSAIAEAALVPAGDDAPEHHRHGGEYQTAPLDFVLRSSLPRRQMLHAHERAGLKPFFTQSWRFRVPTRNVLSRMIRGSHHTVGAVEVTVRYLSSTALLLVDPADSASVAQQRKWAAVLQGSSGSGFQDGDAAPAATVLGAVVGPTGAPSMGGGDSGPAPPPPPPPLPFGSLHLRVRIQNGHPSDDEKALKKLPTVTCVRVELLEEVLLQDPTRAGGAAARPDHLSVDGDAEAARHDALVRGAVFVSEPVRLGYQDCVGDIKPGAVQSYDVVIALPPRFRRTADMTSMKVKEGGSRTPRPRAGRGGGGSSNSEEEGLEMVEGGTVGGDADADAHVPTHAPGAPPAPTGDGKDGDSGASPGYSYSGKRPPPPPAISTAVLSSRAYLRVTLPKQDVLTEVAPAAKDVLVLAEAVDETDGVAFLPMTAGPV